LLEVIESSKARNVLKYVYLYETEFDPAAINFDRNEIAEMKKIPIGELARDFAANPGNYTSGWFAPLFRHCGIR
jgi:hypothetical protein